MARHRKRVWDSPFMPVYVCLALVFVSSTVTAWFCLGVVGQ